MDAQNEKEENGLENSTISYAGSVLFSVPRYRLRKRQGSKSWKPLMQKRPKKSQHTDQSSRIPPPRGPGRPKNIQISTSIEIPPRRCRGRPKKIQIEQTLRSKPKSTQAKIIRFNPKFEMSQVTINVENARTKIRTATLKLLKGKYQYFREKLENTTEVTIENVTFIAFKEFLNFVHNDKLDFQNKDLQHLLSLMKFANKPTINDTEIQESCQNLFLEIIVKNPVEIYFDCRQFNYEDGYNFAFNFILKNLEELSKTNPLDLNRFLKYKDHGLILFAAIADMIQQEV